MYKNVSKAISEYAREHNMARNVTFMFAMDAIMLGHPEQLVRLNRQADDHHSRAMAAHEIYSRILRA